MFDDAGKFKILFNILFRKMLIINHMTSDGKTLIGFKIIVLLAYNYFIRLVYFIELVVRPNFVQVLFEVTNYAENTK